MAIDLQPIRKTVAALLGLLALQATNSLVGKIYWLNLANSEPRGLYRLEKLSGAAKRGEMVIMKVPASFRHYVYGRRWLPEGWSLFKHVGAVPGDVYCVTDSSLTINGIYVGPVHPADSSGLPLPRQEGCRIVPDRHFLPVAVRSQNSFDGRYMGPVDVSEIRGIAKPILTF
jgi:conjugative transfer signal peptidase TraF